MLVIWVGLYVLSGIVQPLLTDAVKYHGGTRDWPPTLLPLAANCIGMFFVGYCGPIVAWARQRQDGLDKQGGKIKDNILTSKVLFIATVIDLVSGMLTSSGLLLVGSGVYTIIYSSTTAWTAVLAWFLGEELPSTKWFGIAIVTLGLTINGIGVLEDSWVEYQSKDDDEKAEAHQHHAINVAIGVLFMILGTILHAGAFVYNERVIKGMGVSPFHLCSQIGKVEVCILLVYNFVLICLYGPTYLYLEGVNDAGSTVSSVIWSYLGLIMTNMVHALAFFSMLGQLGAVSTGILKSVLAVSVFSFAAIFYCSIDASQCLTPFKAASMVIVIFGSFTFVLASKQRVH
mmetsp:Transcript_11722/g.19093  ORF Transcript_11722/g.19093 Transcript_11722/m.19093 type:complete len:344 (-) Transcript_11722:743-1774(-)|eukprot:CAMPEP_0203766284 /NCGR_PEP_ID=MMETSP0099_2-20121227/327_1 /ASSEMBLY_ACC=CAM_ASM_000209 /TAXON_ID=96639 /ORGANISM=" , Strain NY0313808BC1" /LENGTH=343 /DNA_ID=CAMNT_0050662607 /DNA_START=264 /DNA_END=1295 /DNA_ORIENTATION=+